MLRFATCRYVDEGRHIILKGASGTGKTYIACALGNAACRKFKKVRYIRMPELLDELDIAKANGDLRKVIAAYKKVDLLILDEWLIRYLTPNETYNLLEICAAKDFPNLRGLLTQTSRSVVPTFALSRSISTVLST